MGRGAGCLPEWLNARLQNSAPVFKCYVSRMWRLYIRIDHSMLRTTNSSLCCKGIPRSLRIESFFEHQIPRLEMMIAPWLTLAAEVSVRTYSSMVGRLYLVVLASHASFRPKVLPRINWFSETIDTSTTQALSFLRSWEVSNEI